MAEQSLEQNGDEFVKIHVIGQGTMNIPYLWNFRSISMQIFKNGSKSHFINGLDLDYSWCNVNLLYSNSSETNMKAELVPE